METMKLKIGFVPSYRFGEVNWCRKLRADSLAAFAKIAGMEVVVPSPSPDGVRVDAELGLTPNGMVANLEQGDAVAEYFRRERVDGLILCAIDFGDERSATKIAESLGVPVLLYGTKEPPALNDAGLSRASDSYCGNLSMASGLYRRKIPFQFAGLFFPDEPEFYTAIQDFVRAVSVVRGLKGARIGQVGLRPQAFETVAYDEVAMIQKFGQNVIQAELSDLVDYAQRLRADDPAVEAVLSTIRGDAPTITVTPDHLVNAARFQLALTEFYQRNRLSAMGVQCWPAINRMMKLSVCAIYGRLTEQGLLTACETDILGSLSMLVNYRAALGQVVPHFIDWTIQHRQNSNWLLAWHCGNAPASLAKNPAEVALRSRSNMTGELRPEEGDVSSGLYQFQLKPGQVTFCRLVEYDNEWKMLITSGEIIPSDETLAGTWSWVSVRDHAHLYRTLVEEGFIHHASMIHGDQRAALQQACKFLAIKPVVVD